MQNEMKLPIRAAPYRHRARSSRGGQKLKIPDSMTPPVRVKLYEHQIEAFLFVLGLFDALDEGAASRGGDDDERFHG